MQTLKLAVIGAGHLGSIHARLAAGLAGATLVAVVDPLPASRERLAAELGVEPVADYRQLAGRIDAAIVATPTASHHEVGTFFITSGVHCLIEKPLAVNLTEAKTLCRIAERQGVVLQVGHVERFNPALEAVLPHLSEPKYIQATRASGYTFRSIDVGVVFDLMIHDLDVALSLVRSPVTEVQAFGISLLGRYEDLAQARLIFQNGCIADFTASRASCRGERSMQVFTPQVLASIDFGQRTAKLARPSERLLRRDLDPEALSPEEKNHFKEHFFTELLPLETVPVTEGNAIAQEQRDFVESVASGRTPRVSGSDGRLALEVAEQIVGAIARHRWDGHEGGRIGPFLRPISTPLRGPHFPFPTTTVAPSTLREAG